MWSSMSKFFHLYNAFEIHHFDVHISSSFLLVTNSYSIVWMTTVVHQWMDMWLFPVFVYYR